MRSTEEIIKNKQLQLQKQKLKPIAIDDREIDLVLEEYKSLRDINWTGWHAKHIKANGVDWYIRQCAIAKEGNNPRRYLTWLIKKNSDIIKQT